MPFIIKTYTELKIQTKYDTDFIATFTVQDDEGTPIDTSLYTYNIVFKEARRGTVLIDKTVSGSSTGSFVMDITKTEVNTNLKADKCYYYYIRQTDNNLNEEILIEGEFKAESI